jgi:hypothetical protein
MSTIQQKRVIYLERALVSIGYESTNLDLFDRDENYHSSWRAHDIPVEIDLQTKNNQLMLDIVPVGVRAPNSYIKRLEVPYRVEAIYESKTKSFDLSWHHQQKSVPDTNGHIKERVTSLVDTVQSYMRSHSL